MPPAPAGKAPEPGTLFQPPDLVSGSEVNGSLSAAEDGRLCRTDLTLGVQSSWGGAGAVRMAVQTWRGDTTSGPGREGQRGSAGEARWAAPRQRPGPCPAPRRPPRFAFAPRPLGDAQAARVEEARVPRRARGRAPGREGPRTHASESAGRALGAAGPHVAGKTGSTPSRHSDPAPGGCRGGYHRPSATPVRRGIPGGRGEALSRAEASGCQEDVREARGHPTQGRGQGRAPVVEGPRALPAAGAARLCCGRSHRTGTGALRPRGPRGPSSLLCPLRAPGGRLLLDVGEVTAATTAPEWPTSGMAGPAPRAPAGCWRSQPRARRW